MTVTSVLLPVIRAALQAAGGGAAIFSDDEISRFLGAVVAALSMAWSLYDKYRTHQKLAK